MNLTNPKEIQSAILSEVRPLNPSVKLFRLKFPSPFSFIPGQFVMIHFVNGEQKEVKRAYSIASAPSKENTIDLCIRKVPRGMASTFLHDLKDGESVKVTGPFGKFSLDPNIVRDLVLIAGGTGIAPIRSILQTLPIKDLPIQIIFYFGINSLDDFLFKEELEKLRKLKNFKLVLVVKEDAGWDGEKGYISEEILKKHTPDLANKEIYMCGPPQMIRFIKAYLPNLGAKPAQIHIDAWE